MTDTFKTNEKLFRSLPKEMAGSSVVIMDDTKKTNPELFPEQLYPQFEENFRKRNPIQLGIDKGSISFTLQTGPIKEVGVNGCQIDALIEMAREIIAYFNKQYPCRENSLVLTKLDEAMMWLKERTSRREREKTEGTNQEKDMDRWDDSSEGFKINEAEI